MDTPVIVRLESTPDDDVALAGFRDMSEATLVRLRDEYRIAHRPPARPQEK